jgi:fibronectin type 3 domain-containing protein
MVARLAGHVIAAALCLSFGLAKAAGAQPQPATSESLRPTMLLVPRGDTVFVYFAGGVLGMPRVVLTREAPGQGTQEIAVPVPERNPEAIEAALGSQWPMVREMARVADGADLLRLLDRDPVAGAVLGAMVRPVGRLAGRLAIDAGVVAGRDVTYRAQFLDARGRPDGAPVIRRVRVADAPMAAPPTPRLSSSEAGIRLSFTSPRLGGPTDRTVAYVVERREGTGAWTRVAAPPLVRVFGREVAYDEALPADGRRYEWRLVGFELSGREGPPSAAVGTSRADVTPPAAPGETMARPEGTRIVVTWPQAPEVDASGYLVERSSGANGPWTRLTSAALALETPQFVDSTVPARRQYFWRVRTIDRAGNVGPPGSPAPATRLDLAPPAAATTLAARAERGAMVLSWALPPVRDLLGVHVWRGDDTTRLSRLTDQPVRGTSFRDVVGGVRGLTAGQAYVYRVVVVDSSRNESAPAELRVVVPDAVRPTAAAGLSARDEGGRYVEITWLPSGAADVRRYDLSRRPAGAPTAASATGAVAARTIATLPAGPGPFVVRDSAVTAGTRYVYSVVAADSVGNASLPVTTTVEVRTATPPPAPRYVAVERQSGVNVVRWERVVAETLAGYVVDRAPTPTGPFTRVTRTPVTALRLTDAAGTAGAWYVVRAVDAAGRESQPSPAARGAK